MLYDLSWLSTGQQFPPTEEFERVQRYEENAQLFNNEHFAEKSGGTWGRAVFARLNARIQRVIGNFEEIVSFPILLNYHRLVTIKTADLVAGEYPTITADSDESMQKLKDRRDEVSFDSKLYATIVDLSRYGDAIWRVYRHENGTDTFTLWDPKTWFPVVSQDGTNTILYHVLAWIENLEPMGAVPIFRLHVQIHGTEKVNLGHYIYQIYALSAEMRTIGELISSTIVPTGLDRCAVIHLKAYERSDTIYGADDYMPLDSLLAEIMARIGQISIILDKHANPNLTGPVSMLTQNPVTGEKYLKPGSFFATAPGDAQPKYMTWDGQLTAAFKELEILIDQLYILSEMGSAMLGATEGSGQAISGTAMRFKMVNPIAKARRISNSLTLPVRLLMEMLTDIPFHKISVFWYDGLPDDPKENIENAKLATGEQKMMPLKDAIMEFFARSPKEAQRWLDELAAQQPSPDPNHPGPQDGTGVNPQRNGSETGMQSFHSPTNNDADT